MAEGSRDGKGKLRPGMIIDDHKDAGPLAGRGSPMVSPSVSPWGPLASPRPPRTLGTMATPAERHIGSVIDGRYRLARVLGSGGMGIVYQAEQLLLQQPVALKLLHTHLRSHPRGLELQQRFLREAQSLARLGG